MRKSIVLLALLLVGALATSSALGATHQAVTKGFYRGKSVGYLDFGPIKLKPGNELAPIWSFTNGTKGQRNIIDTVPGKASYSPLWKVTLLTWKAGAKARTLRSAAAVRSAVRAGRLRVKRTRMVVNCPVLGFHQAKVRGFAKGHGVEYLDLGPVKLAAGNLVAPIWAVTNGTDAQRNIIDVLPGDDGYTPLWAVTTVTWKEGVTPRTLTSKTAVLAAMRAGEVTLHRTRMVVNCPVV